MLNATSIIVSNQKSICNQIETLIDIIDIIVYLVILRKTVSWESTLKIEVLTSWDTKRVSVTILQTGALMRMIQCCYQPR